jgi:formylglycine-generating enzyme required for sulfatase activity
VSDVPLPGPQERTTPRSDVTPVPQGLGEQRFDFLAPPQRPDELGRLGPYRVLKVLGAGGMGLVLQAEDPLLQRSVALKVMRPELAAMEAERLRFLREAVAAAAVEHHHIVPIYQIGEDRGVPFIAMPLLKGETLAARLKREGALSVADSVRIGRQIAEGLVVAHEHGLIHRDIKPANIWLEARTGWVKIVDFGLARSAQSDVQLTEPGALVGTPAYLAPEQAAGQPVDARCDLFSLGAILYRMCTGQQAFKGADTMSLLLALATEEPTPVRVLRPAVPQPLADLVVQLLAKAPAQRPASARKVAEALAALEQDSPPVLGDDSTTGPAEPTRRWLLPTTGRGRAGLLVAGGAAVLLLVLLGVFLWPKKGAPPAPDEPPKSAGPARPAGPETLTNSIGMKLVKVPAGKFWMGSSPEEIAWTINLKLPWPPAAFVAAEGPRHEVDITRPFFLGAHEVTVGQFRAFVKATGYRTEAEKGGGAHLHLPNGSWQMQPQGNWMAPGFEQTDEHPVLCVSWNDAMAFCAWLSKNEGRQVSLPTEAQWEHACRAGTTTRYSTGDDDESLKGAANIADASCKLKLPKTDWARFAVSWDDRYPFTAPVGRFRPNGFGLFDMHGNAWEWCADWYDANYYKHGPAQDPPGPGAGDSRVIRGGAWAGPPSLCRSAFRHPAPPSFRSNFIGFRVVLVR